MSTPTLILVIGICQFRFGVVQLINSSQCIWSITNLVTLTISLCTIFRCRNLDVVTQTLKTACNNVYKCTSTVNFNVNTNLVYTYLFVFSHKMRQSQFQFSFRNFIQSLALRNLHSSFFFLLPFLLASIDSGFFPTLSKKIVLNTQDIYWFAYC